MRAVVYDQYGGPEVLHETTLPRPTPGPGEALVRVKACGINGYDLMAREGSYKPNRAFPHILGGDIAGYVEAYGPECRETLPAGTRVMLYWVVYCGECEECNRGFPTTCLRYQYLGAHLRGGYAEYVTVPEANLIDIGDYDYVAAAAFPMAFGTSWHMLVTRAQIAVGETVLIQAVGSGIGMAAVQIAHRAGAVVIGTASSDEKLRRAKDLGLDFAVNYRDRNLRDAVMEITNKRGVDLLFEHVGGEMWRDAVGSVTRNGRIVTCGGTAGYEVTMNIAHVFHKQLKIIGSNSATRDELHTLADLLRRKQLAPVVDSVFPVEEAARAHQYVADRRQFGKVVLEIGD